MKIGIVCSPTVKDAEWIESEIVEFVYEVTESSRFVGDTIEYFNTSSSQAVPILNKYWPEIEMKPSDEQPDIFLILLGPEDNESQAGFFAVLTNNSLVPFNVRYYPHCTIQN